MANEKIIQSRIQHKHDIETNWNKATGFIPKQGEIIVYDIDDNYSYERFKIGDGVTNVINLSFADETKQNKITGTKNQFVGFDENGNAVAKDAVHSNWNQNDETAPDYIVNRPFYTPDAVETVLLEETTIDMGSGGNKTGLFTLPSNFINGQKYKVVWDGISYICTAQFVQPFEQCIGNASLVSSYNSSGNGEPFLIGEAMAGGSITFASGGLHTISISMIESDAEIVKLPIEYHQNSNIINGNGSGSLRMAGAFSAAGAHSFAEGGSTTASGIYSHAEGYHTTSSGYSSHAEGEDTTASGWASHAEGEKTTASGRGSHAEGKSITAASENQHAQGKYNIVDRSNTYAHIVGNGTLSARSNAHTLDWNGNAWFQGDVYVGSNSGTNKDEGSVKLQREIKGTEGQVVGFDENGNAVAKDMIQADWDQSDETAVDYIKNKETITSRIESLESFHANFVAVSSNEIQALFG